jgi:hypothetical protein
MNAQGDQQLIMQNDDGSQQQPGTATMCAVALPATAAVEAMGACGILTPLTAPNGTVGQIVHLHIGLGEAMQFQMGDQVQLVSG